MRALVSGVLALAVGAALAAPAAGDPAPTDPAYTQRDLQNIADAYGRIDGEGGQLRNPAYLPALVAASTQRSVGQLLTQVVSPTHPALTPGNAVPGWNVGNPLRGRDGTAPAASPGRSPSPTGTAPSCAATSTGRCPGRETPIPDAGCAGRSPAS